MGLRRLQRRSKAIFVLLFFFLLHLSFILFHTHNIISDDYTYFYMGKLIVEGNLPYRDFFVGHPPLQIYLYAALILIFGAKIWLVSVIPLFSILIASYIAYKLTDSFSIMVFFLSVFPIFHLSTVGFGLNLGLMFIMLSFYYIDRRPLLSGIFAGISVFCRLHFLPIAATGIFARISLPKKSKYALGSILIAILFCIMLLFLPEAVEQIFFYHINKHWSYWSVMRYFILGIGIIGLYVSYTTRYFLPFAAYLIFLMLLKTVFAYYMIPLSALLVLSFAERRLPTLLKVVIPSMTIGLSLGAAILMVSDVLDNKREVREIIEEASRLDGELCGNNEIVPLVALKTNKRIKNNNVDTNYQQHKILHCKNSITIYRLRTFLNCSIIKKWEKYSLGVC